jgi:DNA-binding CsgD family transcriptional regulator
VVYTLNFHPDLIASAQQHGAHGYLSKTLPARELVTALEAVHAGETVISDAPPRARSAVGLDWPGRGEGLSDRESEILALITQGKSNAEVAALTYLSPNTVKSYIRTIYRKIEVGSRTQAVLWGVDHGFTPDHHRIEHWRGGPERHRWPLDGEATASMILERRLYGNFDTGPPPAAPMRRECSRALDYRRSRIPPPGSHCGRKLSAPVQLRP